MRTMIKLIDRVFGPNALGIVLFLLIIGFSINISSTSTLLVEKQAVESLSEITTWQVLDHPFFHQDTTFRDVCFINATHGWAVGQNKTGLGGGIILNTKDGGDSWQLQLYESSHMFRSIDTLDDQTIWITGTGGLVYSTDGGSTWNESTVISNQAGLGGVKFVNKTLGLTSTMNDVYKTTNGGLTWNNITSWTFNDTLRMIYFTTTTEVWAIGIFGIYHSEDAGETWEKSFNRGGWSLSFVSDTEAWAVADTWLAKMTDGETWVLQSSPRNSPFPPPKAPYFSDIFFIDSENGWIVGSETEIAYTPNGGLDWYSQEFPVDTRVTSIDFINLTHGWVVGFDGYILRTTNGNSLGTHLWMGISNPFISVFIILPTIFIVISALFTVRRMKRRITDSTDSK